MPRWAFAPLFIVSVALAAPSPKNELTSKYKQFNAYYLKGDRSALEAWVKNHCIPKFSYTSYNKTRYSRDGFLSSVLQDVQVTQKVLGSTQTIRSIEKKGDTYIVVVSSSLKAIVNVDSRKMTLSDASVDTDTWIKAGKEWKMQKRIQSTANVQLQPD